MSQEEVHPAQEFLDNLGMMIAIGVGFPVLSYLVWGFMDIIGTPPLVGG